MDEQRMIAIFGLVLVAIVISGLYIIGILASKVTERDDYVFNLTAEMGSMQDEINSLLIDNRDADTRSLHDCIDNTIMLYGNQSLQSTKLIMTCSRQYLLMKGYRVQKCINFTYYNGSVDYFCGFASTTIPVYQLNHNRIESLTIYERYNAEETKIETDNSTGIQET